MPSFIWTRDPAEAYANPYEYEGQEQFAREARALLVKLTTLTNRHAMRFHRDDTSVEKAVWMLQTDALDSLSDCLDLLGSKRHRIAGRLFRDTLETLDLAAYFHSRSDESISDLARWYADEIVPHARYRDFLARTQGDHAKADRRDTHRSFSKLTHRTYRALAKGYVLGKGDHLVYEGSATSGILIPPQTISEYYALIASLILLLVAELSYRGVVPAEEVATAWSEALEPHSVHRRFVPHHPRRSK